MRDMMVLYQRTLLVLWGTWLPESGKVQVILGDVVVQAGQGSAHRHQACCGAATRGL